MRPRRIAAAGVLAPVLVLALASSAALAKTWSGPQVISGWKNGPVAISSVAPTTVATLPLPKGRWIIWSKLFISSEIAATNGQVDCALYGSQSYGRADVWVSGTAATPPSIEPLALSVGAKFGKTGGNVQLQCLATNFSANPGQYSASWIKIMALRVGTMIQMDLDRGVTVTSGSGKPVAVIASRGGPISLPGTKSKSLEKLWLSAGSWWVRSSFTYELPSSSTAAECTLSLGNRALDWTSIAASQSVGILDGAAWSGGGGWLKTTCQPVLYSSGQPPETARYEWITAVKLGSLQIDENGTTQTYGTGKPKAEVTAMATIPNQVSGSWSTVASRNTEAGSWMFLGKVHLGGAAVTCQLIAAPDYDQTQGAFSGYLVYPFAVVHTFAGPGAATLQCQAASGSATANSIRIMALNLATLQNTQLP